MEPSTGTDSDHGQVTEDENKELLANDEETEVTSAREEEAGDTPIAVAEEEAAGAPMAAVEEEVGIAPMAATEEEAAGAPMAAVEEEVGIAPMAAAEEEAAGAPMAAVEEEVRIAPMAAAEEEAAGAPMAAVEEEVGIAPMAAAEEEAAGAPMAAAEEEVGSAPMASVEEEIETVPVAVLEERPTAERDEPDTTWQGILEYGEPSFVQLSDASSVRIEVGSIPSRYYSVEQAVISPQSSTTSSLGSEEAVQGEHHLEIGAARSVFFSPYSDAALRPLALQLRGLGPTEEEETILRFTEQELGSGEQEEETQLIVLDPEHPLMKRFQAALKAYLNKQLGKLAEELREQAVAMKNSKIQREDLGVTLYGVQQQLARLQMELEKNHSRHSQIAMTRRQLEEELQDLRSMYKKTCQGTSEERKKVSAMQSEIENMSLRLFYMQNMDQDVRDDIAVMKRTVKKAEVERMRAEVEKQKQDLHVDRLTRRADELQEQIALYEAQYMAQAEDTRITRKEVGEACTEIQAIHLEKKQLLHQWTVSLTGMKRRDEAYAAMQEALRDSRHKLKSLEIEIEVYKKSISKEEERNELLASILNRAENDANTSRKLIAQSMTKQDAMKVELGTYTRTLQETEQALGRANVDRAARMNELVAIRREIEKGTEIKQEMENEIVAKLQDQLMSNKAAKYFLQLAAKLQSRMMDLDIELTKIENDTAQTMLDITNTTCKLNTLQKTFSEVDKEMDNMNNHISHSETEIAKRNLLIGRKQGVINLYNKKLEMMISQLGGQELGPLELEIKKLTKQIDDIESELVTLQRYWLKQQNVLVKLTQEREEQLTSLDMLKKEITIKEQKKVRIENEIQQEKNQLKDIERHMKNMANDLEKLHTLINKNSATSEELQQGNTIMENDFVRSLKVSERESIEMQEKLDHLREEKERLLNCLVEAECQMMQWEKKIQLAKEMRAAVDSETGQGDIRAMKSEIHRMQVRYSQLMRQQEKMMRDTEAAVARRETIVVRGEGQSKQNKQLLTKSDFHYKKLELMKKIKETQKNAAECNITIAHLEKTQKNISNTLLEKQKHNAILNVEIDELQLELDQLQIKKQQNLSDIVANQTRVKHMQAVKEGKYSPLYRTELIMRIERQKLEERLYGISVILHQIEQEFPQHYRTIRRLSQFLHSRLDETAAPEDGAGSQT